MSLTPGRSQGLKKRDMPKPMSEPARGVLHFARDEVHPRLERFEAGETLRPFVEHYWSVTWERQAPVMRETVPHPSVHLTLEPGRSEIHGVYPRRFSRLIQGLGRVLGVKFRPGGFRAFTGGSVAGLTGKVVAASTVFGTPVLELEVAATACRQLLKAFALVEAFLAQFHPTPTTELSRISEIVGSIVDDRSLTRAEVLAERFAMGLRQLQRLFREYVGLSPKWVIRRYRLIEAAERLRAGDFPIDFAGLALDLGYANQSHFICDFRDLVGVTPAEYHSSLRRPRRGSRTCSTPNPLPLR
jgi:AraC-like DNA-binding protein